MRKFFVNSRNIKGKNIEIIGSDVNHIKNVLRLKKNDKVEICNQETFENYICEIYDINNELVILNIIQKEPKIVEEKDIELDIFQGLPKSDKMELIIQKGTELGVNKFIPVAFNRCVVKLSGKDEIKKIERWQKIAKMASEQSHRYNVPKIDNIHNIKNICNLVHEYDIILVAYEEEKNNYIKNELINLKELKQKLKIGVIVGPEGGFEKEEINILKDAGCKIVSLGKRILRTETAPIMISSVIMYEFENE